MILKMYSIFDKYNGFAPAVVMPNHDTAIRWFEDMIQENPTMRNHNEDFSVHYIGQMNSQTGELIPVKDNIFLNHDLKEIGDREERK